MILASSSPQRKELMNKIHTEFKIIVSNCDETFDKNLTVYENVMNVAFKKADTVRVKYNIKNQWILGCDTVVYLDNKVLGKPDNYDDAFNMIKSYNNKTQEVISGVSLIFQDEDIINIYKFFEISYVTFKNITDEQINKWLSKNLFMDKAGSYAIQKSGDFFEIEYNGSVDNIIGLPTEKIKEIVSKFNLKFF